MIALGCGAIVVFLALAWAWVDMGREVREYDESIRALVDGHAVDQEMTAMLEMMDEHDKELEHEHVLR